MNKEKAMKPKTETFKEKAMLFLHILSFKTQEDEGIVYNSFVKSSSPRWQSRAKKKQEKKITNILHEHRPKK